MSMAHQQQFPNRQPLLKISNKHCTQKWFLNKDSFSKCEQIRSFLWINLNEKLNFLCSEKQLTRLIYWGFSKLTNFWPVVSLYTP